VRKTTFAILCLEGAVLSFNVAAAAALVPSIAKDFALSQFIVGRIIWLYMLPYGLAALVYGPLVRAFDARKVELVCMSLFSLANLFAGLSVNIYALFTARFFTGLFGASVIPLGLILIARHIEAKNRGRFVGIFFSATFIASLSGLFLSAIIPWRLIFLIPAVSGFLVSLLIYFFLPSFKQDTGRLSINYLSCLRDKRIFSLFSYIFLISIIYHGIQQWLGVYFCSKFNLSQFLISMLITLTSLSGIFGEFIGGLFSDLIGRAKIVNLGIMLMVLSVFLLLLKTPVIFLSLIMIIWGLGWTFNHAGLSTLLTDISDEFLNESASLNSSVRFISGGLGAVLGGAMMQQNLNLGFMVFGSGLLGLLFFGKILIKKI